MGLQHSVEKAIMYKTLAKVNGKKRRIGVDYHIIQPFTRRKSLHIHIPHPNPVHNTKEVENTRRRLRSGLRLARSMEHSHVPIKRGHPRKRNITNITMDHHLSMPPLPQSLQSAETSSIQMPN